jgi:hypothetical protein
MGTLRDDVGDLGGNFGDTMAHIAAQYAHLPASFSQWELTNTRGTTVAHKAAEHGRLTEGFDKWWLMDGDGWTVAHAAVAYRVLSISDSGSIFDPGLMSIDITEKAGLPPMFDQWGLKSKSGQSVLAHMLELYSNRFTCKFFMDKWEAECPLCASDEDVAAFKSCLPDIYGKFIVEEALDDGHCCDFMLL